MKPDAATHPASRGFALLLVLLLAPVLLTLGAGITLWVTTDRTQESIDTSRTLADELAQAAEPFVLDWLRTRSSLVVLQPEVQVPAVSLLRIDVDLGERPSRLVLTAFDQCAMVPAVAARSGRLGLPPTHRAVNRTLAQWDPERPLGLDLFVPESGTPSPYPAIGVDHEPPPLGAVLGTHNLGRGVINVHTAPHWLLDEVYRGLGRGDLPFLLESRRKGERTALATGGEVNPTADSDGLPTLVTESRAWAVRVDATVGAVTRSWWTVYRLQRGGWHLVQRHLICV